MTFLVECFPRLEQRKPTSDYAPPCLLSFSNKNFERVL